MKKVLITLVTLVLVIVGGLVVFKKISNASLIRITKSDSLNSLLKEPSKIIFVTNNGIYASDKNGNKTERIATINSYLNASLYGIYDAKISGISLDSKWLILNLKSLYNSPELKQFLYALNLQTLKLIKIGSSYCDNAFISFDIGADKLIYGFQDADKPSDNVDCIDLNTGNVSHLLDSSKNDEEKTYWFIISPDKKYIAYTGGNVGMFPDNKTGLYLKNLETGKLKMLVEPSNLDPNMGQDYIQWISFAGNGREILYGRMIWTKDGKQTIKWYTVNLEGYTKEIPFEEWLKLFVANNKQEELKLKMKKVLNKDVDVRGVLDKCKKIIFEFIVVNDTAGKLYICNNDFLNIYFTGIKSFSTILHIAPDSCKFTCGIPFTTNDPINNISTRWYLINAMTNEKINLNELFKTEVKDAIYIEK